METNMGPNLGDWIVIEGRIKGRYVAGQVVKETTGTLIMRHPNGEERKKFRKSLGDVWTFTNRDDATSAADTLTSRMHALHKQYQADRKAATNLDSTEPRDAKLTMQLRAASGYESDEMHQINPRQWKKINRVLLEDF